eukprot:14865580-Alexandrium_andersonii.AAC.1
MAVPGRLQLRRRRPGASARGQAHSSRPPSSRRGAPTPGSRSPEIDCGARAPRPLVFPSVDRG